MMHTKKFKLSEICETDICDREQNKYTRVYTYTNNIRN